MNFFSSVKSAAPQKEAQAKDEVQNILLKMYIQIRKTKTKQLTSGGVQLLHQYIDTVAHAIQSDHNLIKLELYFYLNFTVFFFKGT